MNRLGRMLCLFGISSILLIGNVSAKLEAEGIIGGNYSVKSQFPYQVSIQLNGKHTCGGSIIANQYILTAAHCLIESNNTVSNHSYTVVVNAVDLNNYNDGYEIKVVAAYASSKYDPTIAYVNDIAILKLKRALGLDWNSALKKVNLPRFGDSYAGRTAVISGFGYTKIETRWDPKTFEKIEGKGSSDLKLKYAYVDIISNSECGTKHPWLLFPQHICGQVKQRKFSPPQGICYGDSGSPLVVDNVQVGVTSTGVHFCEESTEASQYTRVSSFLSFIDTVLKGKLSSEVRIIPVVVK